MWAQNGEDLGLRQRGMRADFSWARGAAGEGGLPPQRALPWHSQLRPHVEAVGCRDGGRASFAGERAWLSLA